MEDMNRTATRRREKRANLRRTLKPRHIAFVGGEGTEAPIAYCRAVGFTGPIWPVSLTRSEIGALKCYKRVGDLPEAPDATFLVVPADATVKVVAELAKCGSGGAVCF